MNHEKRASWIKRIFMLFLAGGIVAGAWFYQKSRPVATVSAVKEAVHELEVIHFHQPGLAESEQIADALNRIAKKYKAQVLVTRVDLVKDPASAKSHGVVKAPHVVFVAGGQKADEFQGLWAYPKIEFKVEEILRGLKRVGKDWLPEVKGMQPASGLTRSSSTSGP